VVQPREAGGWRIRESREQRTERREKREERREKREEREENRVQNARCKVQMREQRRRRLPGGDEAPGRRDRKEDSRPTREGSRILFPIPPSWSLISAWEPPPSLFAHLHFAPCILHSVLFSLFSLLSSLFSLLSSLCSLFSALSNPPPARLARLDHAPARDYAVGRNLPDLNDIQGESACLPSC